MVMKDRWLDAQVGVIGSVLIEPELAPRVIAETDAGDYTGDCLAIYNALRAMLAAKEPIDAMTVRNKLGLASAPVLKQIMCETPTSANVDAYIAACKEQSRLTQIQRLASALVSADTLEKARDISAKISVLTVESRGNRVSTMHDLLDGFMERHRTDKPVEYLDWGIAAINDNIHVGKGKYILLGGYPSDGKTALMLQLARHMSGKHRVGLFSLETDPDTISDRLVSHASQVPLRKIMKNDLLPTDWQRIMPPVQSMYDNRLEMIEASGMTASDITAVCLARNFDVVFIDYIQHVKPEGRKNSTRAEDVAEISRQFQHLAKRHKVNVIALSQFNRPEARRDGTVPAPTIHSFRDSGQLEQDADVAMLLYRTQGDAPKSPRMLRVVKNKEGELGKLLLRFDGATQTFSRAVHDEIERYAAQSKRETRLGALEPATEDNPFRQQELPM